MCFVMPLSTLFILNSEALYKKMDSFASVKKARSSVGFYLFVNNRQESSLNFLRFK